MATFLFGFLMFLIVALSLLPSLSLPCRTMQPGLTKRMLVRIKLTTKTLPYPVTWTCTQLNDRSPCGSSLPNFIIEKKREKLPALKFLKSARNGRTLQDGRSMWNIRHLLSQVLSRPLHSHLQHISHR